MYLHLGNDVVVLEKDIVGIFDLDTTTNSKNTKKYLSDAEKKGDVLCVTDDLPKSFVVCNQGGKRRIYLSQISTLTLNKRSDKK